ncbi:pyridine nucleotide-disulphide oxidoreductase dimerisation region [Halorhabdus utahensis DSM 12940]|uniref:Pyridine nucleotide-disulphide oxidoreductase dimerisation region n=1 Tax=Halorhabdus utahensis (strain DSM 12940 / JCM 11049 / AX-2) TaxID=519442 RepID=C7NUC8_HALUD|nr:dihydrolipoyl dehydrogenase [Halorhabdus utahensis]ACV11025.1 pyridine nucleotide-disulphide oxidoreductase dimerisation region [Halorhabdus utahensis DSM 12940]
MAHYDVVVIGGGTGNNVAAAAADAGLDTALIEKGSLGGTCLNRGCNPSKMLIQAANAAQQVQDADRFFLDASLHDVDFSAIVSDMDETLSGLAEGMEADYRATDDLTLYDDEAVFVDERTVLVDDEHISGEKVVVAAGSRPFIPPIEGLGTVEYLTSREALYLDEQPESLVIIGGGYIAVELGYVFETLGTDVTIIESGETLLGREDPEVSEAFTEIARKRHDVHTGYRATAVEPLGEGVRVFAEGGDGGDDVIECSGEDVLVAAGRRPNSDSLDVASAGIETDNRGFIVTDERLQTSAENVWAQGDIAGNAMFKHAGDYETRVVIDNVVHDAGREMDLSALPHAVFTEPQIAGVGATEAELKTADHPYVVGRQALPDTPMGRAKKLEEGFVKVLATPDGEILGCHMLGEEVSTMIHEVLVAMRAGSGQLSDITDTIHAHPTLNKAVEYAFRDALDA